MSYNVQIAGNSLNVVNPITSSGSVSENYDIKIDLVSVLDNADASGIQVVGGSGVGNDFISNKFNILLVTNPEDVSSRKVETIKAKDLFPLMGNADPTKSYYATYENDIGGSSTTITYNGFDPDDYDNLPKINEGNIPYLHGELIKFGTIPFNSLPTDQTAENPNTVLSQRGAMNTLGMLGRAITVDSAGNLILLGYKPKVGSSGETELVAISKANIKKEVETPMTALSAKVYPR